MVSGNRCRHVQATAADKEGVTEVMAVARPWHGQEHREVPEQDLQQRRNVAEDLDIDRHQPRDQPVRGQPQHADRHPAVGRQLRRMK